MRKRVAISCFLAGLTFGMPAAHSQNVPVTNGLRLWLDATDSNTLYKDTGLTQLASAGDDVVGWKDKSGNSFDATAPFLAPTLQSDTMNGRAALRFEGSAGAGMLIDDGLYIDRPYSIFVVNQFYGGVGRTLQSYSTNWLLGGWSGSVANYAVNGFVGSVPADQNVVYVADTTGEPDGNSTFHVNNYDATNNQAPNGAPGNLGLVSVGSFAGEGANADISEVLVYDHVLADNELTSVRNYLYTKYNAQPLVPDLGAELNTVLLGKLGTFTGADEGEGLDLNGDIRYAINVGGPETVVGSVTFTDGSKDGMENGSSPGASVNAINEIPGWISPAYGDSEADLALASVVQSIRYGAEYKVDLDVNHGETYQLQLMFAESCCDRGFDISIDGTLAVDNFSIPTLQEGVNNATKGVVYSATITAQSDLLSIVLNGKNPRVADNLPILNAITLEKLTSIPGDYDHNGVLDATDLDLQAQGMLDNNAAVYDLTGDSAVDFKDREFWISTLKHTYVGDANLDGQFDSEDFVQVFIAGKYETGETATWTEGDWSGDKTFNSEDFVVAFIGGGYEVGPRGAVAAVPEPASALLWLSGAMVTWCCHRKRTVRR